MFSMVVQIINIKVYNMKFGHHCFLSRPRLQLKCKAKAVSTVTGLEWPRGFQKVKVPRFHDNSTGW
jgi:hypothetical protein